VKTLEKFPHKALPNTCFTSLHSPDLTRYFDPYTMQIRAMISAEPVCTIASSVFESEGWKNGAQMSNKFKWNSSDSFSCINSSGLERTFYLTRKTDDEKRAEKAAGKKEEAEIDFHVKEFGFTVVPYFNPEEIEENHFYDERQPLSFMDTKERLIRKYHDYKRATAMFNYDQFYNPKGLEEWKKLAD
jgi:hypothetical protein